MESFWFIALTSMLGVYVLLDGFDLGAGMAHFLVGKNDEERRMVLHAIGPFWDGNEVWLIAFGGTLYFAFPRLYAASFSGFYLPLMIVLWLLILRAIGIEFRHHLSHPMWLGFWDVVFSGASFLLTIFFGAALGNILRGVPLDAEGNFFTPLWTTFAVGPRPGVLDWYTLIFSAISCSTLLQHGAAFLALKIEGPLQQRARAVARSAWWGMLASSLCGLAATIWLRPAYAAKFLRQPLGFAFLLIALLGLVMNLIWRAGGNDRGAFLASCGFIAGMAATTAFAMFPTMLPAANNPERSITIYDAATGAYGMRVGMLWWAIGICLAVGYFTYLFYTFRGKIELHDHGGY